MRYVLALGSGGRWLSCPSMAPWEDRHLQHGCGGRGFNVWIWGDAHVCRNLCPYSCFRSVLQNLLRTEDPLAPPDWDPPCSGFSRFPHSDSGCDLVAPSCSHSPPAPFRAKSPSWLVWVIAIAALHWPVALLLPLTDPTIRHGLFSTRRSRSSCKCKAHHVFLLQTLSRCSVSLQVKKYIYRVFMASPT